MSLPPETLGEWLACPRCRCRLRHADDAFACESCGRNYPVEEGVTSFFDGKALSAENQAELEVREKSATRYEDEQAWMKGEVFVRYQGDLLLKALRDAPEGCVLDAGCGTGSMTARLRESGRPLLALDFSRQALRTLREKRVERVSCLHGDIHELPLRSGGMAAVISFVVVQSLPRASHSRVFSEMARVLKPGGKLVLVTYNAQAFRAAGWPTEGTYPGGFPYVGLECAELKARLEEAGFENVEIRPSGVFLYLTNLKIRGAWRLYHTLSGVWTALEAWISPLLGVNRPARSTYWFATARKAAK